MMERFSSGLRKFLCGMLLCLVLLLTTACASAPKEPPLQEGTSPQIFADTVPGSDAPKEEQEMTQQEETRINVAVGGSSFPAVLEENEAADALRKLLEKEPLVLEMRDYAGFEKVGPLGRSLPAQDQQTTTQAGDIVLYQSNQIVIFYGSNAWSYTRLGRIEDLSGWEQALGSGDVTVSLSLVK